MSILGIVVAILIFCILIMTHELGHFLVAKANKIYVYEFALGMGPRIWGFKKNETEYNFRLFPIGGMVRMMGEDEEKIDDERSFARKTVLQRMAVIFAGPLMNFITAIVFFVIIFMMIGIASDSNIVGKPLSGQAAEAAGVRAGDAIMEINGQEVEDWSSMVTIIQDQEPGAPLAIKIDRDGQIIDMTITPYYDNESGRWLMGIQPSTEKLNFFESAWLGIKQSYLFTKMLLLALYQMLTGQIAPDVAGPVGVVSIVGQAAGMGLQNVLILAGYLSINLGVINLLPIPAMDGSRLVFLAVEGIRRKPFDRRKEGMVHFIGLMLLFGLMIVITYQDILRLINN